MFGRKLMHLPLRFAQHSLSMPGGEVAGCAGFFEEKRSRNRSLHRDAQLALSRCRAAGKGHTPTR